MIAVVHQHFLTYLSHTGNNVKAKAVTVKLNRKTSLHAVRFEKMPAMNSTALLSGVK